MNLLKSTILTLLLIITCSSFSQNLITETFTAEGKSKENLKRESVNWVFGYFNPQWVKEIQDEVLSSKWMQWSEGGTEIIKTQNLIYIKPNLVSWEVSYVLTLEIKNEEVKITISDITYFLTQTGKAKGNYHEKKRFKLTEDTGVGILDKNEIPEVRKIFDNYIKTNIIPSYFKYIGR